MCMLKEFLKGLMVKIRTLEQRERSSMGDVFHAILTRRNVRFISYLYSENRCSGR